MAVRPTVSQVMQMPRMRRGIRRPSHNWFVAMPPFCFQPCMIAPVLPGETMKSLRWQARAITDPILAPLIGWWLEHYAFYVPVSAMPDAATLKAMFITPSAEVAGNSTRHNVGYMNDDGTVESYDWLLQCTRAIINRWFRGEADTYSLAAGHFTGAPPAASSWYKVKVEPPGWTDSYRDTADSGEDITLVDEAGSGTLTASELDIAMRTWELRRLQGLTEQTYEEFLMTYRVQVPQEPGVSEVELLRYSRAWQYPANTVVPTTGAVTSAVSWVINESADKDRFFKEPGFIVIGTCARPKVYFTKQTSYAASQMTDAFAWLPATLWEHSRVGNRSLITDQLVKDLGVGVFDVKDLLMYGDQFLSDLTRTDINPVAMPGTSYNVEYPTDAEIKAMFVTSASAYFVKQDGHAELTVATSVSDPEPMRVGASA